MKKYRLLITYPLPLEYKIPDYIEVIQKEWKNAPTLDVLQESVKDIDAIISMLSIKWNKKTLKYANKLKIIANFAVGYDNIDLKYCKDNNIIVTNTPDVLSVATAEIAFTLLLSTLRRTNEAATYLKDGKFKGWLPDLFLGNSLEGKTVGIIGAGRIGQKFAQYLLGFNTKTYYYNRNRLDTNIEKKLNMTYLELDRLIELSDIISIHTPLNSSTKNLVDSNFLKKAKDGLYIINTARGDIIDEDALIDNIDKLGGVGLDVFVGEPTLNMKLIHDKIVVLPHIGSADKKTREKMSKICYNNVLAVLNKRKPLTEVTFRGEIC